MSSVTILDALSAQLGREKVVAMCEAFLSGQPSAKGKKEKKVAAAAPEGAEDKPKRRLPFELIKRQAFLRYAKETFPDRFEGVKGMPAIQALLKTLKEEEGVWETFEASPACPQPALEPAHAGSSAASGSASAASSDSEGSEGAGKPKRKWSPEAKASAAAKRAAKKAAKEAASGSDEE
jgi:hypothetical protein